MDKILGRKQYRKWKIVIRDSNNEKGIWGDFQIRNSPESSLSYGYTGYKYTYEECLDEAKELIDKAENLFKLNAK